MRLAIHSQLGPYEILEPLGAGGMGEVYRARDPRLERDVAIKVVPEQFAQDGVALARFYREVRAVAALSHPNIVAIHDIGTDQGLMYAVMELLEGHTLRLCIRQRAIDWPQAVETAKGIANGLAAAHAKGIIHRDIKPENLFLTSDGGLKILDFGLARLLAKGTPQPGASLETQPGVLLGTVAYMSPEQVRGQPADERSDVFSLGCVLYEMVLGRRPFLGQTPADTMSAILHEPPAALSESGRERPAELDRLILRCLQKEPSERFPSARDVALALGRLGQGTFTGASGSRQLLETAPYLETPQIAAASPRAPSLAVLPFRNLSSDPENEFFSDGLAEELLNVLSKLQGLRVASRTSSFAFRGKNEDVRRIGEQLNVRHVLEGSVRKAGNRLRISAQLVNVTDGYHFWSETYNRELQDVFAIQDEIAQSIAKALQVILSDKEKRAIERVPTAHIEAYEYYLRGRHYFHQFRRRSMEYAQQLFQQAIAIDPNYAQVHAGLAECCCFLHMNWDPSPAILVQADASSSKALELAPDLPEAQVARGLVLHQMSRNEEAAQAFETALRHDPNLFEAYYFYGRVCYANGNFDETARLYEVAGRLRPDDYQIPILLGDVYRGLGRDEDAQAVWRHGCRLAEQHLRLNPDDVRALSLGAATWLMVGDRARSLDWAGRAIAMDPDDPMVLYNIACNFALLGQPEEAIDSLQKAFTLGYRNKKWLEHDTDLTSLHGHPRFQALLQRM